MSHRVAIAVVCVATVGISGVGQAQQTVAADAASPSEIRVAETLLRQPVTVDLDGVSLRVALSTIATQANIRLQFREALIDPYTKPVTVHAAKTPLGVVFERVLIGTALRVVPMAGGSLALVESSDPMARAAAVGIVTGTITDAATRKPISHVTVTLRAADGTTRTVLTDVGGVYKFAEVTPGDYVLSARVLGYVRQSRAVIVGDQPAVAANFELAAAASTLDQVIVTATGPQRYRELGHVVSQVNADSLVKEAPITSLSELLTSRVPGLQVFSGNGGVVGGDVAIRIRSQTTTLLDPQPIVIVDGVRYKNTSTFDRGGGRLTEDVRPFNLEARSPLNDLNVNDIETVEVVKGPSASTLYGPDAANGVIVITTKKGKPGKTEWHVYAYPDLSIIPKSNPALASGYRAWGHNPNTGQTVNFNCSLASQSQPNPECVLDSITVISSLSNSSQYDVIAKSRPQWHSGASVTGGAPALTYFFSGNLDSQTGAIQLSPFAASVLKSQLGVSKLSDALQNPNTQQTLSLHTNIASQVSSNSTLQFMANYTQGTQRTVNIPNIFNRTVQNAAFPPGTDTTNINRIKGFVPVNAFLQSAEMQFRRIVANLGGSLQPASWLTATANVGTDLSNTVDRGLEQAGAEGPTFTGSANDYRRDNVGRTANVGITAMAHPGNWSFRSSVGAQYTYANLDGIDAYGNGLAPGSVSISTASNKGIGQEWSETASLGTYGEEVIGWFDRFFVTAALRLDGSTTFGDAYHARPFPKIGASWIVSDEPLVQRLHLPIDELRVRTSLGASPRYPSSTMKYGQIGVSGGEFDGRFLNTYDRSVLSNPEIRPERTLEPEWGVDASIAGRVTVGLTWWSRRTTDQLGTLLVPYDFLPQWANIGNVKANGFEGTLSAKLYESRMLSLGLNGSYSHKKNRLVSLGSATGYTQIYSSLVKGYPLDASFGQTVVSVADTAHGLQDSIITSGEFTLSPVHYLGTFDPPNVYTVTPTLSLFGARVRVSSVFDKQTGGVTIDRYMIGCISYGSCVAGYLKSTPFVVQANLQVASLGPAVVPSDFTRWRELSVTSELPLAWRQKLWLSRASMSFQVRNLALWTKYKGTDPESVPGLGTVGLQSGYAGGTGIPQPRSWTLRFDISP